jgi:hypothetical protein
LHRRRGRREEGFDTKSFVDVEFFASNVVITVIL